MEMKEMILVVVLLACAISSYKAEENIALHKAATMSSLYDGGRPAPKAVDGNRNTYAHTSHSSNQWWRVDLGRKYRIRLIKLTDREDDSHKLRDITILTSNTATDPAYYGTINTQYWTSQYTISGRSPSEVLLNLREEFRYVALFSTYYKGITINEIEIYGSAIEELKIEQSSLVMTADSPSCVSLTWQAVSGVNSYKVDCTQYHVITASQPWMSDICGFSPYTAVTCSVTCVKTQRHEDDGYLAVPVNVTSYSGCANPTAPQFNVRDVVQSLSGTQPDTRKLSVHITSASQPNCASIKSYTIRLYLTGETAHIATRTIISHGEDVAFEDVKAITDYTVTIVAVNNYDKQSAAVNKTIMTQELAPEVVADMALSPVSPYCVNMTWSPPSNINGILLAYKYECTGQDTLSTDSPNITEEEICGFTPYQNVTCNLTAVNSYSDGIIMKQSVLTLCTNPTKVSDIQVVQGIHNVNGHERRNVSITWLVSKANCESITDYNITFIHVSDAGETIIKYNLFIPESQQLLRYRSAFSGLIGGEGYKIKFVSTNNLDMISETSELQFQAEDLRPYDGVSDFQLRSNSSCVNMSWIPPQEPNGLITYYKYKCVSSTRLNVNGTIQDDSFNYIENTDKMQYLVCKLPSESKFNCSIQAGNEAGLSPIARNSVYTKFNYGEIGPPVITVIDHEKISISLKPVMLHHGSLQARNYMIIVEELSYPDQISQVDDAYLYNSIYSKSKNLTYYVAANVSFDESEPDIYFMCGDKRIYGGYYNAPLSTNKLYKIHYAFTVQLNGAMITHVVKARGPAISLTGIIPTTTPKTTPKTTPITVKSTTQPSTAPPTTEAATTTTTTVATPRLSTTVGEPGTPPVTLPAVNINSSSETTVEHSTSIDTNSTTTVEAPNQDTPINHITTVKPTIKITTEPTTIKVITKPTTVKTSAKVQVSTVKQVETTPADHWQGVNERTILRELRCPDPPAVKHADLHDIGQRRWNSTVSYHCDDEYAVSPGHKDTVILTCSKSEYLIELDWTGEIIHCLPSRKVQTGAAKSNEGEGDHKSSNTVLIVVCLVLILIVVLIVVGAVFIIRRKRRKYQLAKQDDTHQPSIVELTERRNGHYNNGNHYATPIVNKNPHSSEPRPERIASDSESQQCLLADDETISYADDDDFSQ